MKSSVPQKSVVVNNPNTDFEIYDEIVIRVTNVAEETCSCGCSPGESCSGDCSGE